MNPFEMVIAIIAIVTLGSLIKARINAEHGIVEDKHGRAKYVGKPDPEAAKLREEVTALKDRIAVLERLVTDTNGSVALDREIERLR